MIGVRMDLNLNEIRVSFKNFDFRNLFVNELGWNNPDLETGHVFTKGEKYKYHYIAKGSEIPVIHFELKHFSKATEIHRKLRGKYPDFLGIFSDKNKTKCIFTHWNDKKNRIHKHDYFKGENTDWFLQAFDRIAMPFEKDSTFTKTRDKINKAFNIDDVTRKFFNDFKKNHIDFQKYISGIKNKEEQKIYSLVILNRLMFIWFLQVKGFLNNSDYLIEKLENIRDKKGKDMFYSYFLKLLFFEGFAKKPHLRSEIAKKELHGIKYINGGLFTPHPVEEKNLNIKIKDQAFEKTFQLFNDYKWHDEDSKGDYKEISHDVLGHIFEKYINDMQRKQSGAYYTPDQITEFVSRSSIEKTILNKLNLKSTKYKYKDISDLKKNLDSNLCKLLLINEDSVLNELTILDPAVGSGAFLISALKKLTNIYNVIFEKMKSSNDLSLKNYVKEFEKKHKSISYGIKKTVILNNLYGVDIMKEATEVCKLRLFLSLVSSAIKREHLEPLPNIDFNIMHGDSLIGLLKNDSEKENYKFSFIGKSYSQIINEYNEKTKKYKTRSMSFDQLRELKKDIRQFIKSNQSDLNEILYDKHLRGKKVDKFSPKKDKKKTIINHSDLDKFKCFHWDFHFNQIIQRGGFDIILTNPPWDKVEMNEKEFFNQYDASYLNEHGFRRF